MDQWYYSKDGSQIGPVSLADLQQWAAGGEVAPTDLVWKDGMADWTPAQQVAELAELFPASAVGGYDVATPYPQAAPQVGYPAAQAGYAAPQLGYASPQLQYFTPPMQVAYAGFWLRFGAAFLDGIILQVVGFVVGLCVGFAMQGNPEEAQLVATVIGLITGWLYEALQESSAAQATIGKRACGIRVTDMAGQRISFARASGRHFGKYLSGILLLVGYIMQAFTEKRQALHDMMAGTLVVQQR